MLTIEINKFTNVVFEINKTKITFQSLDNFDLTNIKSALEGFANIVDISNESTTLEIKLIYIALANEMDLILQMLRDLREEQNKTDNLKSLCDSLYKQIQIGRK